MEIALFYFLKHFRQSIFLACLTVVIIKVVARGMSQVRQLLDKFLRGKVDDSSNMIQKNNSMTQHR